MTTVQTLVRSVLAPELFIFMTCKKKKLAKKQNWGLDARFYVV